MKSVLALVLCVAAATVAVVLWRGRTSAPVNPEPVEVLSAPQPTPAAIPAVLEDLARARWHPLDGRPAPPRDFGTAEFRLVPAPPAEEEPAPVEPPPNDALLVVQVISSDTGEPLVGERIWTEDARSGGGGALRSTSQGSLGDALVTDDEGRAEFAVPSDRDLIVEHERKDFSAPGPTPSGVPVPPLVRGERRELLVELPTEPDLKLWVQVVRAEDDVPIAGAKVAIQETFQFSAHTSLGWSESTRTTRHAVVLTANDGRAELAIRTWQRTNGEVEARGRAPFLFEFEPGHEGPENARLLRVPAAARLTGAVLGTADEPKAGLDVRLTVQIDDLRYGNRERRNEWWHGERLWSVHTEEDGSFDLRGLPPAPLCVELLHSGRVLRKEPERLLLEPGETRAIVLRLGAGCTLRGLVVADGVPAPSERIALYPGAATGYQQWRDDAHAEAVTDGQGRFVFEEVPAGTWSLSPFKSIEDITWPPELDGLAALPLVLEVAPGEVEHEVTLETFRGLYVSGRVLDPDGNPVGGGWVQGSSDRGSIGTSVILGEDFTLGPLAPGSLQLRAIDFEGYSPSEPIDAQAGDRSVEIWLQRGASVAGTVVDAASGRAIFAMVILSSGGIETEWLQATETDAGAFLFEGVPPGSYHLAATSNGKAGVLRDVSVNRGDSATDLEIRVSAGATLCVQSEDPRVSGFLAFSDDALVTTSGLGEPDSEDCVVVPPGMILVRAMIADGSGYEVAWSEHSVFVTAGERTELVIPKQE